MYKRYRRDALVQGVSSENGITGISEEK